MATSLGIIASGIKTCVLNIIGWESGISWNSFTLYSYNASQVLLGTTTVYYNGTITHPLPVGSYISVQPDGSYPFNGSNAYIHITTPAPPTVDYASYEINADGIITYSNYTLV